MQQYMWFNKGNPAAWQAYRSVDLQQNDGMDFYPPWMFHKILPPAYPIMDLSFSVWNKCVYAFCSLQENIKFQHFWIVCWDLLNWRSSEPWSGVHLWPNISSMVSQDRSIWLWWPALHICFRPFVFYVHLVCLARGSWSSKWPDLWRNCIACAEITRTCSQQETNRNGLGSHQLLVGSHPVRIGKTIFQRHALFVGWSDLRWGSPASFRDLILQKDKPQSIPL